MPNCRKSRKFKNTLLNGTSIFQALNDIDKHHKLSFLNENVGFLFVDVLRTKEVDKSTKLYPYSFDVTHFCIAAVLQMAGTNGDWPSLLDWSLYISNLEFQCRIALKRLEISAIFEKSKRNGILKGNQFVPSRSVLLSNTPSWDLESPNKECYELHSKKGQKCPIITIYTPFEKSR